MAKVTGKNALVSFASTLYSCLTDLAINGTGGIISTECSTDGTGAATTNRAAGAEAWSVTTTMLLEGSSATVASALDAATSGALKAYPQSDETGDLEYSWTTAVIGTHNVVSGVGDHMKLDVTFDCDGAPTIGVKSA